MTEATLSSPATGQATSAPLPARRSPIVSWLLGLVTGGIYTLFWYYKVNQETAFNPRSQVNAGKSLLAITLGSFVIVPPFISIHHTGQRIADAQAAAGLTPTCNPTVGLLIAMIGFMPVYFQGELNKIADAYPQATAGQMVPVKNA